MPKDPVLCKADSSRDEDRFSPVKSSDFESDPAIQNDSTRDREVREEHIKERSTLANAGTSKGDQQLNKALTSKTKPRLLSQIETLDEPHKTVCIEAWHSCVAVAEEPSEDENARHRAIATAITTLVSRIRSANLMASNEDLANGVIDLLHAIPSEKAADVRSESWITKMISELPRLDGQPATDQLAGLFQDTSGAGGGRQDKGFSPGKSSDCSTFGSDEADGMHAEVISKPTESDSQKPRFSPGQTIPVSAKSQISSEDNIYLSFASRIRQHWHKCTEGILDTAAICAHAKSALNAAGKKQLMKELPFSPSTFSKLAKIGGDYRLKIDKVRKRLPANYSIIYEVRQLTDHEMRASIEDGVLSQDMKREDFERWRSRIRAAASGAVESTSHRESSVNLPDTFFAGLRPTRQWTSTEFRRLKEQLAAIGAEFNIEVRYGPICGGNLEYERIDEYAMTQLRRCVCKEVDRRKGENDCQDNPPSQAVQLDAEPDKYLADEEVIEILDAIGQTAEVTNIRIRSYERFLTYSKKMPRWCKGLEGALPPQYELMCDFERLAARYRSLLKERRAGSIDAVFALHCD